MEEIRSKQQQAVDATVDKLRDDVSGLKGTEKFMFWSWLVVLVAFFGGGFWIIWRVAAVESNVGKLTQSVEDMGKSNVKIQSSIATIESSVGSLTQSLEKVSEASKQLGAANDALAKTIGELGDLKKVPAEVASIQKSVIGLVPTLEATKTTTSNLSTRLELTEKAVASTEVAIRDLEQLIDNSNKISLSCRIQLSEAARKNGDEVDGYRFRYLTVDGVLARALTGRRILSVDSVAIDSPRVSDPETAGMVIVSRGELLSEGVVELSAWVDNDARFKSSLAAGNLVAIVRLTATAQP